MKAPMRIFRFFKALTISILVGGIFFFLLIFALHPNKLPSLGSLSIFELWLVGIGALIASLVCLWRLHQGSSVEQELRALRETALSGDHLG